MPPRAPDPFLQALLGVIRTLLALVVGTMEARGALSHDAGQQLIALGMVGAIAVWSVAEKLWTHRQHGKVRAAAVQVAAENAAYEERAKLSPVQGGGVGLMRPNPEFRPGWPLVAHD